MHKPYNMRRVRDGSDQRLALVWLALVWLALVRLKGRARLVGWLAAVLLWGSSCVSPAVVWGQQKYSPLHEDVQRMMNRGLDFLSSQEHRDLRELVLIGTAAYKAQFHTSTTPTEHPLVQEALERIAAVTRDGTRITSNHDFSGDNYGAAVLIIFLLDTGADKHASVIDDALDFLLDNQQESGAWGYTPFKKNGDTSQMQYVGLALWLASKSDFDIPVSVGKRALQWMISSQQGSGGWFYTFPPINKGANTDREIRHSMVASGAGTVYVLAEWLQLASGQSVEARKKRESAQLAADLEIRLPTSVSRYDPDNPQEVLGRAKVEFDLTSLRQCMTRANGWLTSRFRPDPQKYPYYYLYAFERYASLRELVDGSVSGLPDWYDRGVEWLKTQQRSDGSFPGGGALVNSRVSTALAILFLSRSMQLSINAKVSGTLAGGEGFEEGDLTRGRDGQLRSSQVEASIEQMAAFLDTDSEQSTEEIKRVLESVISQSSEMSVAARMSDMRDLLRRKDAELRLLAVQVLGKYRNLDNVPALLFAMTDPEPDVAIAAHRALEFISRKVDVFRLAADPYKTDFKSLERKWRDWYLSIRPDARLYDASEK